jgi:hypothetical protein
MEILQNSIFITGRYFMYACSFKLAQKKSIDHPFPQFPVFLSSCPAIVTIETLVATSTSGWLTRTTRNAGHDKPASRGPQHSSNISKC